MKLKYKRKSDHITTNNLHSLLLHHVLLLHLDVQLGHLPQVPPPSKLNMFLAGLPLQPLHVDLQQVLSPKPQQLGLLSSRSSNMLCPGALFPSPTASPPFRHVEVQPFPLSHGLVPLQLSAGQTSLTLCLSLGWQGLVTNLHETLQHLVMPGTVATVGRHKLL